MKSAIGIFIFLLLFVCSSFGEIRGDLVMADRFEALCGSVFNNVFCSGDSACRRELARLANARNCNTKVVAIESKPGEDVWINKILYKRYYCLAHHEIRCF